MKTIFKYKTLLALCGLFFVLDAVVLVGVYPNVALDLCAAGMGILLIEAARYL
jgi:hypothetical protein